MTKRSLPLSKSGDGKIKFDIRVIEDGKVRKPLFIAEIQESVQPEEKAKETVEVVKKVTPGSVDFS